VERQGRVPLAPLDACNRELDELAHDSKSMRAASNGDKSVTCGFVL
jgi:hypothetical protein